MDGGFDVGASFALPDAEEESERVVGGSVVDGGFFEVVSLSSEFFVATYHGSGAEGIFQQTAGYIFSSIAVVVPKASSS